jgi:thiol-activated cytolysin
VDYGRILMLRIETSAERHSEIEGAEAFERPGEDPGRLSKDCREEQCHLITIGAMPGDHLGRGRDSHRGPSRGDPGQNALYSKNNPGQPIAYTVRFLKDGRLAKMGYSTDYTELVCERHPHGWIGFKHSGAYVAKFFMNWKEGGQPKSWSSGKKTVGYSDVIRLKGNARDINITAQAATGLAWNPWGTIFKLTLDGPPNKFYVAKGTTLKRQWGTADR